MLGPAAPRSRTNQTRNTGERSRSIDYPQWLTFPIHPCVAKETPAIAVGLVSLPRNTRTGDTDRVLPAHLGGARNLPPAHPPMARPVHPEIHAPAHAQRASRLRSVNSRHTPLVQVFRGVVVV